MPTTCDHISTVVDVVNELFEGEHLRLRIDDRKVDDAKGRLHRCHREELVENDRPIAPFFNSMKIRIPWRSLITQIADAFDLLVRPDERCAQAAWLYSPDGELSDHDGMLITATIELNISLCAHLDNAAPGSRRVNTSAAINVPTSRKVRPRDEGINSSTVAPV